MSHIRKAIKPGPGDYSPEDIKQLRRKGEVTTIGKSPRNTDFTQGNNASSDRDCSALAQ